jgi:hypothetical protein
MSAYLFLREKRHMRERAWMLVLLAIAQSGDGKAIQKRIEEWEADL